MKTKHISFRAGNASPKSDNDRADPELFVEDSANPVFIKYSKKKPMNLKNIRPLACPLNLPLNETNL